MSATRILMTGSRSWSDRERGSDALQAVLAMLDSAPQDAVLVHGAARGADEMLASIAKGLGITTEAHPAQWGTHTTRCPDWDKQNRTCKLAGHRRNSEMIAAGADVCLAFPTHGYHLAPGEARANTSRGTWDCAEQAKNTGLPTIVVWGKQLYPFGDLGAGVLGRDAQRKGQRLGPQGQIDILDAWLPF